MDLETVKLINDSPYQAFFAIAGGGQTFIGDFTSISGASNTVVGALVPYSKNVFDKFIKHTHLDSYASEEAARKLAVASYNECLDAGVSRPLAIGVGSANSIVKDNERVGREHRFYIAIHTHDTTRVLSVILKQCRNRQQEETLASLFIFRMLADEVLNTTTKYDDYVLTGEYCDLHGVSNTANASLIDGKISTVLHANKVNYNQEHTLPVFCGSWNPFHEGHQQMYDIASRYFGIQPLLELSITNTDKGELDFIDINQREKGIESKPYILTNAPTFINKVRVLKNKFQDSCMVFIVGMDTWVRIWDEKYGHSHAELHDTFKSLDIKFLVFGRDGIVPSHGEAFMIQCEEAANFQRPISSTEIRKQLYEATRTN